MARLLWRQGILFQHIPRTGGSWIEQALDSTPTKFKQQVNHWVRRQPDSICKKHAAIPHYYPSIYARKVQYRVAFVRHPISFYESIWRWIKGSKEGEFPKGLLEPRRPEWLLRHYGWHPKLPALKYWCDDYGSWVDNMLHFEPSWATRTMEYYVGPEGGEWCDFIGRQESLVEDFRLVMNRFGYGLEADYAIDQMVPRGRLNAATGPRCDLTLEQIKRVLASERPLLRRFYGDGTDRRYYARLDSTKTEEMVS